MKIKFCIGGALALFLIFFPSFVFSQDNQILESFGVYSYKNKPDEYVFVFRDTDSGKRTTSFSPSPIYKGEDIRLRLSNRWHKSFKELEFGFTEQSWKYRDKFEHALVQILNNYPGTPDKPPLKLLNRIDKPAQESGVEAFIRDGKNTIVMEENNSFLDDKNSIAFVRYSGFVNDLELAETDAFFNSKYFNWFKDDDKSIGDYHYATKTVIHEFGHIYGSMHTCWDEDIMLDVSRGVLRWNFENPASLTWQINKLRDRLIYSKYWDQKPLLIPMDHAIVEISQMRTIPTYDDDLQHYFIYEVANTNLHGRPGDPLSLAIYKGWHNKSAIDFLNSNPFASETPLLKVYSEGLDDSRYGNQMSIIHMDNQDNLTMLIEEIQDSGTSGKLRGAEYTGILKVTLVIEGYLKPDDKNKSTIFSNVYLTISNRLDYRQKSGE